MGSGKDIYSPSFVKEVFDRCSQGYRYWSYITSFGFTERWRSQCVQSLPDIISENPVGFDLMAGTGEVWPHLFRQRPNISTITAVDISEGMHMHAINRLHKMRTDKIKFIEADILELDVPENSADFVIATFGLKTFNKIQQQKFSKALYKMLKPGGVFSLIEASEPKGWLFHPLYMFYLVRVLPLVERLFLRGAQDFSMFHVYAKNFGDCSVVHESLKDLGLDVSYQKYFFGCASGVVGRKPLEAQ